MWIYPSLNAILCKLLSLSHLLTILSHSYRSCSSALRKQRMECEGNEEKKKEKSFTFRGEIFWFLFLLLLLKKIEALVLGSAEFYEGNCSVIVCRYYKQVMLVNVLSSLSRKYFSHMRTFEICCAIFLTILDIFLNKYFEIGTFVFYERYWKTFQRRNILTHRK